MIKTIEQGIAEAKKHIGKNPEVRTASFHLTNREYIKFCELNVFGEGYIIIQETLGFSSKNNGKYDIIVADKRFRGNR